MRMDYGFSLVECAVGIVLMVVVAGMSALSMILSFQNSRIVATTNEVFTMINVARSEAIRRNARVTLCGLSANQTCLVSSGKSVPFDSHGWALFEDAPSGPSTMLGAAAPVAKQIRTELPSQFGVWVRANFVSATFSPLGTVSVRGAASERFIKICKGNATNTACDMNAEVRCIVMSKEGRPSIMVPSYVASGKPASKLNGNPSGCV